MAGHIVYGLAVSVDGYIARGQGGDIGLPVPEEALHRHFNEMQKRVALNLYGRNMYEVMKYWDAPAAESSDYEQEFAQTRGVNLRCWSRPRRLLVDGARVRGVEFESTSTPGETYTLDADVVFKAIGQKVSWERLAGTGELLEIREARIAVDEERRTSLSGVWAGGDCVYGGEDLTVSAVQDGKLAALSIDRFLRGA